MNEYSLLQPDSKIYVAGHNGLVGSAIVRNLKQRGFVNLICRTSEQLDLTDQDETRDFFNEEKPDFVFLAAARVGGILANNTYPENFIRENLLIQTNVIESAHRFGVSKLIFLGSSCIYPRDCPQPILESYLLTGPLELTNQWYAIAKIAGIKLCQAYRIQHGFNAIAVMPTNTYGPYDNFDKETSHVLPALIGKFHRAKIQNGESVIIWGSGRPMREFIYVDDLADACVYLLDKYDSEEIINIGTGKDISIKNLSGLIKNIVGYSGDIKYDQSFPDGTPRKLLDISKLESTGWKYATPLKDGIEKTYNWAVDNNRI